MSDSTPLRRRASDLAPASHPQSSGRDDPNQSTAIAGAPRTHSRLWPGVALGCAVLLSTWGLGETNRTNSADSAAAMAGAEFTGTIKPSQRSVVTVGLTGTVRRVLVAVGDHVSPDTALVELDDSAARAALDAARLEVDYASAEADHWRTSIAALDRSMRSVNVAFAQSLGAVAIAQRQVEQVPARQFRDSPERAQAVFDHETSKLQRLQKLHAEQLVSDEQLDEQKTAVRIAQNDLRNAREWHAASSALQLAQQDQAQQLIARSHTEFQQLRTDYAARLTQANSRADQARQRLAAAERQLEQSVVRATTAGIVVDVAIEVGSAATAGSPLVTIARLTDLLVEVPVSAKLVNVLQVGDAATVTLPTLPPQQATGRIGSINPIPAANMTHAIEVEFANNSGQVLTGQQARVLFR